MNRPASSDTALGGLVPPSILIFFHIPKTGGGTMDFILRHCFPANQNFIARVGELDPSEPYSSLWIAPRNKIAEKYRLLSPEAKAAIRCISEVHPPMGIHTIFERPAKYFTLVRHPVDRVVSQFYYMKTQGYLPIFERIKDMTLDQYLDSRISLDPFDHQVRMLCGSEDLDEPYGIDGRPIHAVPVEARHLQMAKRNIEENFLTAAPLEEFTSLVVLLRRIYGWSLRHCLFEAQNVTRRRPKAADLSETTRRRVEDFNRNDMALYEWVKARFAAQILPFQPQISWDRHLLDIINGGSNQVGRLMPRNVRKAVANLLLFS